VGVTSLVREHVGERVPALGRVGDDALVVAVGEDPAAAAERLVDGPGHPDLEALDAPRERAPVVRLHEEVDVLALDAEVDDPEDFGRVLGFAEHPPEDEAAADRAPERAPAQAGQAARDAERDVDREAGGEAGAGAVGDAAGAGEGGLAAGAAAFAAPGGDTERELRRAGRQLERAYIKSAGLMQATSATITRGYRPDTSLTL